MIKKAVTIKDVAEAAGVSTGSVSRVINGYDVNPEIRERVRGAIEMLNYCPSVSSQTAKNRGGAIVILISNRLQFMSIWTQQVVTNLALVLGRYGYRTLLRIYDDAGTDMPQELLTAEGCIAWGNFSDIFYRKLEKSNPNLALAVYSRRTPVKKSVSVLVDHKGSMCRVVEYLVARNHRDLALIAPQANSGHQFERQQGFLESMAMFGCRVNDDWLIAPTPVPGHDSGIRAGYKATQSLLAGKNRPSAIIYASDLLAYGGMEAVKEQRLAIPEEMSIVGFDDLPLSRDMFPPLTTMRMDTEELARVLVDAMERLLLGREPESEIILSRTLIERDSVSVRANGK